MPANGSTASNPDAPGAETVTQLRRALGRQLAAMRNRAGLSQWELAPLTGYSRSTLSDAELGRHRLRREFWLRCDELLKADSRLVASYDRRAPLRSCASVPAAPRSWPAESTRRPGSRRCARRPPRIITASRPLGIRLNHWSPWRPARTVAGR
jgi:DNA-binding XRE family transcriptional regulator